jgi:uncharacterized membrane protein
MIVVGLSVIFIVFAILVPPVEVLHKADLVGYAVCHRIPERSFILAGRQLPLCARCTGTFLGAVLGLILMLALRRGKATRLPPVSVLIVLIFFVGFWGFDGLNSYMTLFPGAPNLYEPQNWLRLTTGLLNGLALVIFVFPIFNFTIWRDGRPEPVIANLRELLLAMPFVALLVLVIQAQPAFLLYPLAIISSLGVLMLLVMINGMLAAVILGREGYALTWRQALVPLVVGTALAVMLIAFMVLVRDYLTARLGLPF